MKAPRKQKEQQASFECEQTTSEINKGVQLFLSKDWCLQQTFPVKRFRLLSDWTAVFTDQSNKLEIDIPSAITTNLC